MKTVISAARLMTPTEWIESPRVLVEDGHISAVGSRESLPIPAGARELDFGGMILAPGLIDVPVQGGAGPDVMGTDPRALEAIEGHMARHGVTSYLATTVTAPHDLILRSLEHLGKYIKQHAGIPRAVPLGVHLEGPFISHAKRGVHPPESLVEPTPQKLDAFWNASAGGLALLTLAPGVPGSVGDIRA